EREVDALGLLLLAQLQTVAHNLLYLARLAVLAWGEVPLFNGALLGEALWSFEEELDAVAAAHAADGSCVTCHFYLLIRVSIALQATWPFFTIRVKAMLTHIGFS